MGKKNAKRGNKTKMALKQTTRETEHTGNNTTKEKQKKKNK
jgi:hypothetical protein